MIGFIIVGIAALVVFLQFKVSPKLMEELYECRELDMKLVEPDEKIRLKYGLINAGRLPIMFVNLFECLPDNAVVLEDDEFIRKHVKKSYAGLTVKHRMYLLPDSKFAAKVHFALTKRGVYKIGKCYLETGDFLGFHSNTKTKTNYEEIVVMPKVSNSKKAIEALGGFIGEISVRRFIMEDPVLTIGFRDYTGREPFKDISWIQYAKAGKLQVKQYDYTTDTNVAVVLNMDTDNENDLEGCYELTRMVCEELEKKHIPYQFISNGDVSKQPEGLGKAHLNAIMEQLGRSKHTCYYGLEALIDDCIREKKSDRSYIVVSPANADKTQINRLQKMTDQKICTIFGGEENE